MNRVTEISCGRRDAATVRPRLRCFAATGVTLGALRTRSPGAARWQTTSPQTRSSGRSPRSGRFDDRRPFGPWLHRIVANRALDLLRAERRLSDEELPDTPDVAPAHATGDRGLLASVAELSLERRVVVVLRYGVGMTPKQIAEALDLPVGTVNSRLARSLEQLRESLEVEHVE